MEARSVGDWLYDFVARYETAWLIFVLVMVFGAAILGSRHKHFWFDEIFTIIVASQPSWHKFAQAMPADGQPPITALLTRLSIRLFGITNFSVRLPEMLGFLSALVGMYVFVRREAGAVFGLFAVVVVIAQPAWMYSFEARPYGIILAFLMLGMLSWQSATRAADTNPAQPRKLALLGIALATMGCILTHHLGVVDIGAPLLFGEGVRLYKRRRFDRPLAATAIASAAAALAVSLPMIYRTNRLLFVHLPKATVHSLADNLAFAHTSFSTVVNAGLLELLAGLVFVTWCPWFLNRLSTSTRMDTPRDVHPVPSPHILAAAVGLMLLIPITFFLMMRQGGWYFCRYGIGSVLGIAILASLLLAKQTDRRSTIVISLLVFLVFSYARALQTMRHRPDDPADNLVYDDRSNLPIVVSDPLLYPQIEWYAPASMKTRIVYLYETPSPLAGGWAFIGAALIAEKPLISAPLQTYTSFTATHDHFVLDVGQIDAKLKETLEAEGYKTVFLRGSEHEKLYDVQR